MQLNIVFRDWLNSRKISGQVLEDFGIYGEDQIVIPVLDLQGIFSFNKYRRSPLTDEKPKYWYDKGAKISLYGWWKAKDEKTILITEGELDCITAWSHNIPAVTSTGGAMSFQKEWVSLFDGKEVIVCFDNDHAGADGMVKVLDLMPDAKVLFIPDRANMKDISDYVASGGDLHTLLKNAKRFDGVASVKEDMLQRIATFQSVYFHEAYIKAHTKSNIQYDRPTFDNDAVTNAKLYPIPNLMEFRGNKACCPFHNEKTPSFNYFPKTNTCYCFGCSKFADAIDVYRQKFGCSFTDAVANLNKLV